MMLSPEHVAMWNAATELVLEVFRLNGSLLTAGDALAANIGLTSAQRQVMGAIALSPVPLPVAYLARNMGFARQSGQHVVDDVKKDEVVRHAPDQRHPRAMLVLLTEAGESAYRTAMAPQEGWANGLTASLVPQAIKAATISPARVATPLRSQPCG